MKIFESRFSVLTIRCSVPKFLKYSRVIFLTWSLYQVWYSVYATPNRSRVDCMKNRRYLHVTEFEVGSFRFTVVESSSSSLLRWFVLKNELWSFSNPTAQFNFIRPRVCSFEYTYISTNDFYFRTAFLAFLSEKCLFRVDLALWSVLSMKAPIMHVFLWVFLDIDRRSLLIRYSLSRRPKLATVCALVCIRISV